MDFYLTFYLSQLKSAYDKNDRPLAQSVAAEYIENYHCYSIVVKMFF